VITTKKIKGWHAAGLLLPHLLILVKEVDENNIDRILVRILENLLFKLFGVMVRNNNTLVAVFAH
jgi:hypothetical protein